ncbi:MAG: ATP-binding protein [Bacteroidota bacterium]
MNENRIVILLVEDDRDHSTLLKRSFSHWDRQFRVDVVPSLDSARHYLATSLPDIALVDWKLPDGQGSDLLSLPKCGEAFPVVIMTSFGSEQLAVDVLKDGALDYIIKSPATLADMPHIVQRSLREFRTLRRKQEVEQVLQTTSERFQLLASNSSDVIFRCTLPSFDIDYVSPSVKNVFGVSEDEIHECNDFLRQVVHPEDIERLMEYRAATAIGAETSPYIEYRVVKPNMTTRWVNQRTVLVRDANLQPFAIEGIITDIHERKLIEEELRKAKVELEKKVHERTSELKEINQSLRQFANMVSHDLQEPLRMVISYLQLLERNLKGKLDQDGTDFLTFAVDGAYRMRGLLQGVLKLSRVKKNGELIPVSLQEVLEDVRMNLKGMIELNETQIQAPVMPVVKGDQEQLTQLFQNLISNAIKFRSTVNPIIQIDIQPAANQFVCISVKDNGIGFDERFSERIFQMFQRLHPRDKFPGYGVGLSICKEIISRHGGRIWASSIPHKGSCFSFTLPEHQQSVPASTNEVSQPQRN